MICAFEEFLRYVGGKSISVVGNAPILFNEWHGMLIDASDIVIRMNRGLVINEKVQGKRTDIHYLGYTPEDWEPEVVNAEYLMCQKHRIKTIKSDIPIVIYPVEYIEELNEIFIHPVRPSSGVCLLHLLIHHTECGYIELFGFDSFRTGIYPWQTRVTGRVHDPHLERELIEMWAGEGRITARGY